MFHLSFVDWILVAAVPTTSLLLGLKRVQPTSWVDYFLARSQLGTGGTLSNYLGANLVFTAMFLILTLEASRRGWWVLTVPAAFLCGTVLLVVLYPKLAPFMAEGQTLHQALGQRFDGGHTGWKSVRRWASLWTIVAFVSTVALEFYGGILLLSWAGVPELSRLSLGAALAFVCAAFTVTGGLRGVAKVNAFLDGVSFVGILILFGYILSAANGVPSPALSLGLDSPPMLPIAENITFAIGSFLIFTPLQLCALDTWQRGVAWKLSSRRQIAIPLLIGTAGICFAAYVAIVAGYHVRTMGLLVADTHPLLTLLSSLQVPSPLIGLILAAFLAMIFSTADELLNCCGYAVLADFVNLPRTGVSDVEHTFYIRSGKLYTGLFAFAAAGLAAVALYLQKQVTDFANVAFATQVVFLVPLLFAFYSSQAGRLRVPALSAMLAAFVVALSATISGWIIGGPEGQAVIDGASILAFAVSLTIMLPSWIVLIIRRRIEPTPASQ